MEFCRSSLNVSLFCLTSARRALRVMTNTALWGVAWQYHYLEDCCTNDSYLYMSDKINIRFHNPIDMHRLLAHIISCLQLWQSINFLGISIVWYRAGRSDSRKLDLPTMHSRVPQVQWYWQAMHSFLRCMGPMDLRRRYPRETDQLPGRQKFVGSV